MPPLNRGTESRYVSLRDTNSVSAVARGVAFVGRGRELDALAACLAAQGRPAGGALAFAGGGTLHIGLAAQVEWPSAGTVPSGVLANRGPLD